MLADLPNEVVRLIAADPECLLRATCGRFRREIGVVPFKTVSALEQSRWCAAITPVDAETKITISGGKLVNTRVRDIVDISAVYGLQPPYIFLHDNLGSANGLLIWDESVVAYLAGIPGYTMFRLTQWRAAAGMVLNKRPNYVQDVALPHFLSIWGQIPFDRLVYYVWINHLDEFTIDLLKYISTPVLLYSSISVLMTFFTLKAFVA